LLFPKCIKKLNQVVLLWIVYYLGNVPPMKGRIGSKTPLPLRGISPGRGEKLTVMPDSGGDRKSFDSDTYREKSPSVPDGTVRDISPGRGEKLTKALDFFPLTGGIKGGSDTETNQ
jgi:hypothetical protein